MFLLRQSLSLRHILFIVSSHSANNVKKIVFKELIKLINEEKQNYNMQEAVKPAERGSRHRIKAIVGNALEIAGSGLVLSNGKLADLLMVALRHPPTAPTNSFEDALAYNGVHLSAAILTFSAGVVTFILGRRTLSAERPDLVSIQDKTHNLFARMLDCVSYVVEKSEHVRINARRITELVDSGFLADVSKPGLSPNWLESFPSKGDLKKLKLNEKERLQFVLILDSISFCYWGEPKWFIEYKGERLDGARGMMGALLRALEEGKPILCANFLEHMNREDLSSILRGNTEIPLLDERLKILNQAGRILNQEHGGQFYNMVKGVHSAEQLLGLIVTKFSSFKADESVYKGKKILFYKRAQLLISDIHSLYTYMSVFHLDDFAYFIKGFPKYVFGKLRSNDYVGIEGQNLPLLGCADYKIPYALRKLGVIEYSSRLAEKIDNGEVIPARSEEEIEIRANSLWAIKLLKESLGKRYKKRLSSMEINDILWLSVQDRTDGKPYHLTLTTCY